VLTFKKFLYVLTEELTRHQKQVVRGWVGEIQDKQTPAEKISSGLPFDKKGRLYIPYEHHEEDETQNIPQEVKDHLTKKGFSPVSSTHAETETTTTIPSGPRKGEVVKSKRRQSIGSLLSDNPKLRDQYALAGSKSGTKSKNLMVAISRNPEDVAGASTGRGWRSCLTMSDPETNDRGGDYQHYNKKHITQAGTHVAYLIHPDDKDIENPIARISLDPMISASGKHTVLRPPRDHDNKENISQYGGGNRSFGETVKNWAEKNFPFDENEPSYKINDNSYDDENLNDPKKRTHHFRPNLSSREISTIIKNGSPTTVKSLLDHPSVQEKHILQAFKRPEIDVQKATLAHPKMPENVRSDVLRNSQDHRLHESIMQNPNATREHLRFGLMHNMNTVKQVAANNKKAHVSDLRAALQDTATNEETANIIKKKIRQKEAAEKILALRKR
jgi:hypothetical protein